MQQDKPHIILVAYHFPPDPAVGSARSFRFVKYLKQAGYTCDVITAAAQPERGPEDIHSVPDVPGEVWAGRGKGRWGFPIYVDRLVRELIPGGIGTMWSYEAAKTMRAILGKRGKQHAVVISSYPPLGAAVMGVWARLAGVPWIGDFRDPLAVAPGMRYYPWRTRKTLQLLEVAVMHLAAAVIANAEQAADLWRKRYPRVREKLTVIWNGFDPETMPRPAPVSLEGAILHAGSLYEGRNPDLAIAALARLKKQGVVEAAGRRILLVGDVGYGAGIDRKLQEDAMREGWLEHRPPVSPQEARKLTEGAGGLLLLQPNSAVQVPAKLFEYLCIGRPILAVAPAGSAVEFILSGSGVPYICLYPEDAPETADRKVLEFLRLPETSTPFNGWFEQHFNGRRQTEQLISVIEHVRRQKGPTGS